MEGDAVVQEPMRYVTLGEHEALKNQFNELVKHVNQIRFYGPSIELPGDLANLIG